jgi:hypothetical protein
MSASPVDCPIPLSAGWHIGEDKTLELTVRNAAGEVVDITGFDLSWMFKRRMTDADSAALMTKTIGVGLTVTSASGGRIDVAIADTETDDLKPKVDYWHELKRTDDGFEAILAQGVVNLNPSLHKD